MTSTVISVVTEEPTTATASTTSEAPALDNSPCAVTDQGISRSITDRVGVTCDEAVAVANAIMSRDPSRPRPTGIDGWTCPPATASAPNTVCTRGSSSFVLGSG